MPKITVSTIFTEIRPHKIDGLNKYRIEITPTADMLNTFVSISLEYKPNGAKDEKKKYPNAGLWDKDEEIIRGH